MVTRKNGFSLRDDLVEKALIKETFSKVREVLLMDYFGESACEELTRLARHSPVKIDSDAPKVLILPGFLGSKLGRPGTLFHDTIWYDPADIISGRWSSLALNGHGNGIEPIGVVLSVYLKLKLRLRLAGFNAIFHPFDWRDDITSQAAILAERIRNETDGTESCKTVQLVAHSMGGLVSRAAIKLLDAPNEREKVSRLIMLGTPNNGTYLPVQAMSGYSSLFRVLAVHDLKHSHEELVKEVLNTFLGLYQLLPAKSQVNRMDMYDFANWPATSMAPREELLKIAPDIHKHIGLNDDRFVMIAGFNRETIVGVNKNGNSLTFQISNMGDGIVPLALALLDPAKTYYAEEHHALMPNNTTIEDAVIELLKDGKTNVLKMNWDPTVEKQPWDVPGEQLAEKLFTGETVKDILQNLINQNSALKKQAPELKQSSLI